MLVHRLPLPNWTLLKALCKFLIEVVKNSDVNKMNVRNVGIVFSPTLNIPAPVFSAFLTDFDSIFGTAPDENAPVTIEVRAPEPLTPEDIRSPRHQLFSDIPTPSYNQDTFPPNNLNVNYEQVNWGSRKIAEAASTQLQPSYETNTGFTPLQPSYESLSVPRSQQQGRAASVASAVSGSSLFQRTLGSAGIMRDSKARRRESSMLDIGQGSYGSRKLSLPFLKQAPRTSTFSPHALHHITNSL